MSDERTQSSDDSQNQTPEPEPEPTPQEALTTAVCAAISECEQYTGVSNHAAVQTSAAALVSVMRRLRDDEQFAFDTLMDHTSVDRIADEKFELLYHLYSTSTQQMLLVSALIPRDNPVAPTLCGVWRIAEWQERENYDLMGILYDDHPDLRRVFLEDDWKGFPLRKDYQDDFMLELKREHDDG